MIDKMRELITNYVDVSPAEISEDSKFIDDLGKALEIQKLIKK